MNKTSKVILSENAKNEFDNLNKSVGDELKRGINSSQNQSIFRSIQRVIENLKDNPFFGNQIQKSKIPKVYIKNGITNLWRAELADRWRLLYTIKSDEVEILNIVLEICDHKKI